MQRHNVAFSKYICSAILIEIIGKYTIYREDIILFLLIRILFAFHHLCQRHVYGSLLKTSRILWYDVPCSKAVKKSRWCNAQQILIYFHDNTSETRQSRFLWRPRIFLSVIRVRWKLWRMIEMSETQDCDMKRYFILFFLSWNDNNNCASRLKKCKTFLCSPV
jgi:hypothetical protein